MFAQERLGERAVGLRGALAQQQTLQIAGDQVYFEIDPSSRRKMGQRGFRQGMRDDVEFEGGAIDPVDGEADPCLLYTSRCV